MVIDNGRLQASPDYIIENATEYDCTYTCSDNRVRSQLSLLALTLKYFILMLQVRYLQNEFVTCSSFNYIHRNNTCFIYKDRAKPAGVKEIMDKSVYRYFEKFCLPGKQRKVHMILINRTFYCICCIDGSPLECGEKNFARIDQSVLNGFAINVTRTKKLDVCIQACLELNGLCKVLFIGQFSSIL